MRMLNETPTCCMDMRNLEATRYVSLSSSLLVKTSCFCVDIDAVCLWVVSSAGLCRVSHQNEVTVEVPLFDAGHVTAEDYVIGIEHVSDLESVCVATRNGDILLCNTHTGQVECVGSVDGGILAMAWSPDQELVMFGTGTGSLLLMTHQLDLSGDTDHELVPVTEVSMTPSEFGKAEPIAVGWGQKSTQFHGSAGKHSAKETPVQDIGPALPWDDLQPRLSWRGDGEYFVCSCVESESTGGRRLRVWTRDGVLHSTSEQTENLEHTLQWRPSGNVIATTQYLPHSHEVVFFERNGLRHGGFSLPPRQQTWQVHELLWNSDSTILCLWLKERESTADRHTVQLWTTGNYHWYLKQELCSPLNSDSAHSTTPQAIKWDPIIPLRLHIITTDGCYICYEWHWCVSKSSCLSSDNHCNVAVIDGERLLLTLLRYTVTPPPMSTHVITLPSSAIHVTHAPPPLLNDFLVVMANGEMAIFSYGTNDNSPLKPPSLVGIVRLPVTASPIRQLCWPTAGNLVGVVWDPDRKSDTIVEFSLTTDNEEGMVTVEIQKSTPVTPPTTSLISLTSHPHTGTTVAQTTDGLLLRYSNTDGLLPWKLSSGSVLQYSDQSCDYISIAQFQERECIVGLNVFRHTLYVDDCKIATGVTTFDLHNEFLIYTTDSHVCHFISMTSDPCVMSVRNGDTIDPLDEGMRRVERGSKIVAVVPHDFKLVLQMPRGNLETVYPLALVLSSVRRHLNHHRYGDAFITMRKHRINLNLIYDHAPEVFLEHVKEFVEQLSSVTHINLFFTELRDEDTAVTMYPPASLKTRHDRVREGRGGEREGKVDVVCEAVRKVLVELDENKYLLSIITAHVKKSEPELDLVLMKIKILRDNFPPNKNGTEDKWVTAEEALKYTLFLVDVNHLYDVALGMYDFQMVVMVAEKSQKDPKEYLPFLNELHALPLSYQRYRIDKHLHRYTKALTHIAQCGLEKFDECLTLIKAHSLFKHALDIYTDRSSHEHKTIARCYGEYLSEAGDHKAAAILFFQCGCLKEALECFEKAGNWQMAFALTTQLGYTSTERMQLARKMAESFRNERKYHSSSTVLLDYAEDVEEAIVVLLEGGLWQEALRTAYLHKRQDLIETHLKPHLLESYHQHVSLLPSLTSDLSRHSERLQLVRENLRKKQEAILEGTYAVDERDGDLFSDTSSVTGRSVTASHTSSITTSQISGKSRKSRRKTSHKKWSLREGSSHEDLALLEAITDTCGTVDRLQDEIPSLLEGLLLYGHTHEARQLHRLFTELITSVRTAVERAWPRETTPTNTQVLPVTGPHATVNSMLASMATRPHPQSQQNIADDGKARFPRPQIRDINLQLQLLPLLT